MAVIAMNNVNHAMRPIDLRIKRQRRTLGIIFTASFALDFKGSSGGTVIQYLMAGLNLVAFLLMAVSYRFAFPRRGLGACVFWGWMAFLFTGILGALVNAVPLQHFIRVIYPFVLFLEGFLVAWWIARTPYDARVVVSSMTTVAIVSIIFTIWWGFYFTGENSEEIRYQILSPLIPLLIIVVGYDFFFSLQRKVWSLIWLLITFGVIALSVTRGEVLVVSIVAGIVIVAAMLNFMRSGSFPRPLLGAGIWSLMLSFFCFIVINLSDPDILARWSHRSFGSGFGTSFWIRIAAVVGQFQELNSNSTGWLIGQGFGSSYPWPVSIFPWILKHIGAHAIGRSVWFPGEFMWMPFLYYGGFIIGTLAILVLLVGAIRGFSLITILLRMQSWRFSQARPLWIGVLGYFAFLGIGFTSNPFIFRSAAMFMGLCFGLIVVQCGLELVPSENSYFMTVKSVRIFQHSSLHNLKSN